MYSNLMFDINWGKTEGGRGRRGGKGGELKVYLNTELYAKERERERERERVNAIKD